MIEITYSEDLEAIRDILSDIPAVWSSDKLQRTSQPDDIHGEGGVTR